MSTNKKIIEKPIKVGFYQFFPGGGIGRYTHELLLRMAKITELHVELIASSDYHWNGTGEYAIWYGLKTLSHSIPFIRRLRFLTQQFINPHRAIQHATLNSIDVLHLANINHLSFPFWRKEIERSNFNVVATAHDVKRQKSIINKTWEVKQLQNFYQFADALFVHSQYQAEELIEFADLEPNKIVIVPHGIYPHADISESKTSLRKKYDLPHNRQVALFFGQIRDEKNLDGLLRAYSLIEKPPHLVVAGQLGSSHKNIRYYLKLIESLGLINNVTFLPRFIDNLEVGELFTACDWVALPYYSSFSSQSGVLNTAIFYNRPVLASSAPVLKQTIETVDVGTFFEGDAPSDIVQGIEKITQLIAHSHQFEFDRYQRLFSWDKNVSLTLETYKNLLLGVI